VIAPGQAAGRDVQPGGVIALVSAAGASVAFTTIGLPPTLLG
jgi:hypothetical protein